MLTFFRTLPRNIIGSFDGRNIFFHILAIFATIGIVRSGMDWNYFLAVRDPLLNQVFFPALMIGGMLPVALPLFLIVVGHLFDQPRTNATGWILGQAALIGSLISSTYKAFTGRVQPDVTNLLIDSSHGFHFGFWEHGIFWGWPSSHTTIAFAMAWALILIFPKRAIVAPFALIYAFYIGIGVSFEIHWLSEFVAGALIGTAIGLTVGGAFTLASYAKRRK